MRDFTGASSASILHSQRSNTPQQGDAQLRCVELTNEWIAAIASRTRGESAASEATVPFATRISWIMHRVSVILWSIDRVVAVPKRLAAAQQFLALFDGLIEFPEVA